MTEVMTDWDVGVIVLLLPLAAAMVVFQDNPYHALVVRGILGAIAALVYALLGAADVALTEALMGTMLGTALSVVAMRSSLVLRLGVLATEVAAPTPEFTALCEDLRRGIAPHHLRLEVVPYDDCAALHRALVERDIHGVCTRSRAAALHGPVLQYATVLRVSRLYEILRAATASPTMHLIYGADPEKVVLVDPVADPFNSTADQADQSEGLVPQEPH